MIPKIIHYCWFDHNPFNHKVQMCMETWHRLLPDYQFYFWNEANSPMNHPFVREAYKAKRYAFVADYVRIWALYNYGGVYLDTDMYVIKSFDNLLLKNSFICYQEVESININFCVVGCESKAAWIKELLDVYDSINYDDTKIREYVIPILLTPRLKSNTFNYSINILPYDFFSPFPYEKRFEKDFMTYATANTYAIHLWDFSWQSKKNKLLSKIIYIYKKVCQILQKLG